MIPWPCCCKKAFSISDCRIISSPTIATILSITFFCAKIKLKEKDKAIFIMYYYRYKKIEEIAEILKMNPQTVKTRLRRGREILKRILLEEGYDASEI